MTTQLSDYVCTANRCLQLNVRGGHFLQGHIAAFDAPFFSMPYPEAVSLDPQQRGLLEGTYQALENGTIQLVSIYSLANVQSSTQLELL